MAIRQKTTPNFKYGSHYRGWCLKWVDDAVNAPDRMPTAQSSYKRELANGNIRTSSLPVGVWVPVWFTFTKGDYVNFGHVAWAKNHGNRVEVLDSEVGSEMRPPYNSITELMAWFSAYDPVYNGWSYWVDGVKVVEDYDSPIPEVRRDSIVNAGLGVNQAIISQNGKYNAIMQIDGNFVVYKQGYPIWATNTARSGANVSVMQGDGNFVLYNGNKPLWASQTAGSGGKQLIIQNDGNLVIYTSNNKPVWASQTAGK